METAGRQSIKQTLGELGISQTTYPFGPDWGVSDFPRFLASPDPSSAVAMLPKLPLV